MSEYSTRCICRCRRTLLGTAHLAGTERDGPDGRDAVPHRGGIDPRRPRRRDAAHQRGLRGGGGRLPLPLRREGQPLSVDPAVSGKRVIHDCLSLRTTRAIFSRQLRSRPSMTSPTSHPRMRLPRSANNRSSERRNAGHRFYRWPPSASAQRGSYDTG